jgi:hypothetical protein
VPEPVAAVRTPVRLNRDSRFAQDLDIATRRPLGHSKALAELTGGRTRLVLEHLEGL